MSKEFQPQLKPSNFILFAVVVAVMAISVAGLYYAKFSANGASGNPTSWAEFGDYFGGVLNPIIGLFTIIILAITLRINSDQLEQSRAEVKLSQEALKVAMDELKRGQALQEMTEKSLREQIETMAKQTDMSSAVSLYKYWQECAVITNGFKETSVDEDEYDRYEKSATRHSIKQGELAQILWKEHERLITKYGTGSDNWQRP